MKCSINGKNLIKKLEGLELKPYKDQGGVLTVGYGHTGPDINTNKTYTRLECDKFLDHDVSLAEICLSKSLTVPLNQNQIDALISFIFNTGCHNFSTSTLLSRLNRGESPNIVARSELIRWIWSKINGIKKENKGLRNRRLSEIALFTTPIKESYE